MEDVDDEAISIELLREDNLMLEERIEAMSKRCTAMQQAKLEAEARAAALDADLTALRKVAGQEQVDPNSASDWHDERAKLLDEVQTLLKVKEVNEKRVGDLSKDLQRLYKRLKTAEPTTDDSECVEPLLKDQATWQKQQQLVQDLLRQCKEKVYAEKHAHKRRRVDPDTSEHDKSLQEVIAHFKTETCERNEFEKLEAQLLQERLSELEAEPRSEPREQEGQAFVSALQDDLKRLAHEKLQLAKDMQEAQRRIQALTMDNLQFKLEKNELKHQVQSEVTKSAALQDQVDDATRQLAEASAEASQLHDHLVAAQTQLLAAEAEIADLHKRLQEATASNSAVAAARYDLETTLEAAEKARDELAEAKGFWEDKAAKLERVVLQYGSEIQSLKLSLADAEAAGPPEHTPASVAHGQSMVQQFYLRYYKAAETSHRSLLDATRAKDAALAAQGADLTHIRHVLSSILHASLPDDVSVALQGLLASFERPEPPTESM
ncbi:hypothetical protein SPRG_10553 [Saprolegnia parasitica CBS 223.65]|uniref:Uncharacterized protein n=1 Tax=Saprolegnia parasitica (strain CBS 223.65) TaxID=695850 RepID=A0A067CB76_SAPPC|nr:hypothetical protein SPRG_10553 [Saprolegnia parasitica CBS 223.65]KDO23776.1 hypothetical protein SPRG_10553 [Saprolegnia parasitica CBS 223.65]|eukprot:XP_012205591.1 hypothetical protein SPRG_10553 [Saprolegnia parasitica CBS 223.65]